MRDRQSPEVETAGDAEFEQVIDTLVMAFASDPIARWLYPNPHDYFEHFPEFLETFAGKAFDHGTAKYVGDFAAAGLWLPPEVHYDDEALGELLENTVPEDRRHMAILAFDALKAYHPDEPHWHFAAIGVDPRRQRDGLGAALVEDALATSDEQDAPVYLEATNPDSLSLALQYDFEILDTVGGEEMSPFFPMVRRPESRSQEF